MPRSSKTASSSSKTTSPRPRKTTGSRSRKTATKTAVSNPDADSTAESTKATEAAAKAPHTSSKTSSKTSSRTSSKTAKASSFTEAKFAEGGVPEIGTPAAAARWLNERVDIERMRVVRYSDDAFKLDRMRALLELLGNPHEQIRTIHVGGTNGKGGTVAMLASMLEGCGYTVGSFTSPHLIDLRERISIGGVPIDRTAFVESTRAVAEASAKLDSAPTFFEAMTAVAFKHFFEQAVDMAIVEVGLGGRLDSTNVITPEVSIITSIDLDHTRLLGASREEIAREKAGIFKPGVPALVFDPDSATEQVFREVAEAVGAPLRIVNKDIEFSSRFCSSADLGPHTRVCLYTQTSRLEHLPVPLPG